MAQDKTTTNVEQIAQLFPNVMSEGKIDFDLLRQMLSDELVSAGFEMKYTKSFSMGISTLLVAQKI